MPKQKQLTQEKFIDASLYWLVAFLGLVIMLLVIQLHEIKHRKKMDDILNQYQAK